ncbi:FliI/YscN family ATPase [Marivivens aquimaris]|uniref:FliI/YscN family ATPase n=1 Tax=Marivivens aquimaris TaxID=2774876 RepID=UPI00187E8DF2|nr:FliI/YscN family ATPase [Marivivens aquimaris]
MTDNVFERAGAAIERVKMQNCAGTVSKICSDILSVAGLPKTVRIGDEVEVVTDSARIKAEVIGLETDVRLMTDGPTRGVKLGDTVIHRGQSHFRPDTSWIGRVIDPDGRPLDGRPLLDGLRTVVLNRNPPDAYVRRPLGARVPTGLAVFDTMLPIVRGQRIGLFAGSGVGKSTLIANLARGMAADVVVIALVGERGREVREFVENVLGPEGLSRSVVVAATSDQSANMRRRCALSATAVAEHFRALGKHVLLFVDSVTRFAEAHREIAAASGEASNLRGFPASTAASIARLCERAGPGPMSEGDITAIYSVLVAGSDMEEPVADMLRGVLDGHVILSRDIAERGRFPAIDVLRSVSRALPAAANEAENALIKEARSLMAAYEHSELMIQSGLYSAGSDPQVDRAIKLRNGLEQFLSRPSGGVDTAFADLRRTLEGRSA